MKRIALFFIAGLLCAGSLPLVAQEFQIAKEITDWLSTKTYEGAKRQYTKDDLDTVRASAAWELSKLGVSHFTILRNEMYARHGYIFKTPILAAIFSKAPWYKPDPKAGLNALNAMEVRNVNWIKGIEDEYDFKVIVDFLNSRDYLPTKLYSTRNEAGLVSPLELPTAVMLAFNHLYINPSQFFRNEIFARNGLDFASGIYKKIWTATKWYAPRSTDWNAAAKNLTAQERINLALLREREWVEIINAVKFSLPEGVTSIPVVGFNSLFFKEVPYGGDTYHFSYPDAWTAMEEKGAGLDDHTTDTETLVDAAVIDKIKAEPDPQKKIIIYFSSKRYKGYADKTQFNRSDMETPSYLAEAVAGLDLDWYLLLRKEIHARNGAKFIDPKVGPIFKSCSWYKAKYDLNPRAVSRFPAGVKISSQELRNYSLLEGEELTRRIAAIGAIPIGSKLACDLLGNFYFIRIEEVYISQFVYLEIGHAFKTMEEFRANESLQPLIDNLIKSYRFDLDKYREEEVIYTGGGC